MRLPGMICYPAIAWLALCLCPMANGQLLIEDPAATGIVRQTTLTNPLSIGGAIPPASVTPASPEEHVAARAEASQQAQIRVKIQYLYVDAATRAAIFSQLDASAITTISDFPPTPPLTDLTTWPNPAQTQTQTQTQSQSQSQSQTQTQTRQSIRSPSRITTCLLGDAVTAAILREAQQSAKSSVSNAPSVLLLEGKEAEMNDLVQHPFVIDLAKDEQVVKPAIESVDDGTRMRLLAHIHETSASKPTVQLTCEIAISKLLEVRTHDVYGLGEDPYSVQVPVHQVTTCVTTERIGGQQTLLIDPHVTQDRRVEIETGVPLFGKIPYVGKRFRSLSVEEYPQHVLVLLKPTIEKPAR